MILGPSGSSSNTTKYDVWPSRLLKVLCMWSCGQKERLETEMPTTLEH